MLALGTHMIRVSDMYMLNCYMDGWMHGWDGWTSLSIRKKHADCNHSMTLIKRITQNCKNLFPLQSHAVTIKIQDGNIITRTEKYSSKLKDIKHTANITEA